MISIHKCRDACRRKICGDYERNWRRNWAVLIDSPSRLEVALIQTLNQQEVLVLRRFGWQFDCRASITKYREVEHVPYTTAGLPGS
jgi:hypothetical protein